MIQKSIFRTNIYFLLNILFSSVSLCDMRAVCLLRVCFKRKTNFTVCHWTKPKPLVSNWPCSNSSTMWPRATYHLWMRTLDSLCSARTICATKFSLVTVVSVDARPPFHMKGGSFLVWESSETVEVTRRRLMESICQLRLLELLSQKQTEAAMSVFSACISACQY